jgi:MoaA/NifB/PqqE/SkfB family radical SAM enzyme
VDRIQVMNLIPYVSSQKYTSLFYHRTLANHSFTESRRVAAELNFEINIPPDFNVGGFGSSKLLQIQDINQNSSCASSQAHGGLPPSESQGFEMINCYRPWQSCVVGELGDVRPSAVYWKPMGNLSTHRFVSIWNGRKYRNLRASVNTKPHSICYSCRMPRFDSEENRAAMQLAPSVKQLLKNSAKSLLSRPNITFTGITDKDFAPQASSIQEDD